MVHPTASSRADRWLRAQARHDTIWQRRDQGAGMRVLQLMASRASGTRNAPTRWQASRRQPRPGRRHPARLGPPRAVLGWWLRPDPLASPPPPRGCHRAPHRAHGRVGRAEGHSAPRADVCGPTFAALERGRSLHVRSLATAGGRLPACAPRVTAASQGPAALIADGAKPAALANPIGRLAADPALPARLVAGGARMTRGALREKP